MKVINLNESQYKRLFEMDSFVATGGNDDSAQNPIKDFQTRDEVPITAKLKKGDNEVKDSTPIGAILPHGKGRRQFSDYMDNDNNLLRRPNNRV